MVPSGRQLTLFWCVKLSVDVKVILSIRKMSLNFQIEKLQEEETDVDNRVLGELGVK